MKNLELNLGMACNNKCIFCMSGSARSAERRWLPLEKAGSRVYRSHLVFLIGIELELHESFPQIIFSRHWSARFAVMLSSSATSRQMKRSSLPKFRLRNASSSSVWSRQM